MILDQHKFYSLCRKGFVSRPWNQERTMNINASNQELSSDQAIGNDNYAFVDGTRDDHAIRNFSCQSPEKVGYGGGVPSPTRLNSLLSSPLFATATSDSIGDSGNRNRNFNVEIATRKKDNEGCQEALGVDEKQELATTAKQNAQQLSINIPNNMLVGEIHGKNSNTIVRTAADWDERSGKEEPPQKKSKKSPKEVGNEQESEAQADATNVGGKVSSHEAAIRKMKKWSKELLELQGKLKDARVSKKNSIDFKIQRVYYILNYNLIRVLPLPILIRLFLS